VVQLALTDDLFLQSYWKWEPHEICEMLIDYFYDLGDTKTALAEMVLVGPLISKLENEVEFDNASRLAYSVGVDLCVDDLSIHKCDALNEADERARRYGQPREPVRPQVFGMAHML
jgi:hypothetical protein